MAASQGSLPSLPPCPAPLDSLPLADFVSSWKSEPGLLGPPAGLRTCLGSPQPQLDAESHPDTCGLLWNPTRIMIAWWKCEIFICMFVLFACLLQTREFWKRTLAYSARSPDHCLPGWLSYEVMPNNGMSTWLIIPQNDYRCSLLQSGDTGPTFAPKRVRLYSRALWSLWGGRVGDKTPNPASQLT